MTRIAGHVDGFIDGTLYGWLADLDDPRSLERIILRDGRGRELSFSTHVFRNDVCKANNIQGVFGFALKRSWLDGLTGALTALNRDGRIIPGGNKLILPRGRGAPPLPTPLDIFVHIPKTGGTSVRNAIMAQIDPAEALLIYPDAAFGIEGAQVAAIPLHQRRRMRIALGHVSYGLHDIIGVESQYHMILRDPATRLRSNFDHHAARGTSFRLDSSYAAPSEIVNEGLLEEFDNLAVRVAAGLNRNERPAGTICSADVDRALHNVREHFAFVGLYETLDESFAGLCEALRLQPCILPRDNTTPQTRRYSRHQIEAVSWLQVLHNNRYDMAFYDAVQRTGLVGRIAR